MYDENLRNVIKLCKFKQEVYDLNNVYSKKIHFSSRYIYIFYFNLPNYISFENKTQIYLN